MGIQALLLLIISSIAHFLSMKIFGFSLLDAVLIIVILFYAYEGYMLGVIIASADLLGFILSFIIALKFYLFLGSYITHKFLLSPGLSNALAFFLIAFLSEVIINILFRRLLVILPPVSHETKYGKWFHTIEHYLGIIPGIASSLIILCFILSIIIVLPSAPLLKNSITNSQLGSALVRAAGSYEKDLRDVFGGAIHETLTFMTVEPKSTETVNLHFKLVNGPVDMEAEQQMFTMVNHERTSRGLAALTMNRSLQTLARAYSQDMFARGYFSHYNPEGMSPFDRMEKAGITYTYAGENLALAPSTDLAMQGLMNSPGHKANILNVNFKQIGIGVIDGGIYGKMYTQEFTD